MTNAKILKFRTALRNAYWSGCQSANPPIPGVTLLSVPEARIVALQAFEEAEPALKAANLSLIFSKVPSILEGLGQDPKVYDRLYASLLDLDKVIPRISTSCRSKIDYNFQVLKYFDEHKYEFPSSTKIGKVLGCSKTTVQKTEAWRNRKKHSLLPKTKGSRSLRSVTSVLDEKAVEQYEDKKKEERSVEASTQKSIRDAELAEIKREQLKEDDYDIDPVVYTKK